MERQRNGGVARRAEGARAERAKSPALGAFLVGEEAVLNPSPTAKDFTPGVAAAKRASTAGGGEGARAKRANGPAREVFLVGATASYLLCPPWSEATGGRGPRCRQAVG